MWWKEWTVLTQFLIFICTMEVYESFHNSFIMKSNSVIHLWYTNVCCIILNTWPEVINHVRQCRVQQFSEDNHRPLFYQKSKKELHGAESDVYPSLIKVSEERTAAPSGSLLSTLRSASCPLSWNVTSRWSCRHCWWLTLYSQIQYSTHEKSHILLWIEKGQTSSAKTNVNARYKSFF